VLLCHLHHTQLAIHELVFLTDGKISEDCGFDRLESYCHCLTAIKSYFDVFITFMPGEYVGFSTSTFFQMTHCILSLYKLSTIEDPGWDTSTVMRTANVVAIGQAIANNLRGVAAAADLALDGPEDLFSKLADFMEAAMRDCELKLRADGASYPVPLEGQSGEMVGAIELDPELTESLWLTDLLAPLGW
jgi:hypothetical protein